jgi:hypothetical protein
MPAGSLEQGCICQDLKCLSMESQFFGLVGLGSVFFHHVLPFPFAVMDVDYSVSGEEPNLLLWPIGVNRKAPRPS